MFNSLSKHDGRGEARDAHLSQDVKTPRSVKSIREVHQYVSLGAVSSLWTEPLFRIGKSSGGGVGGGGRGGGGGGGSGGSGHMFSVSCATWYPVDTGMFFTGEGAGFTIQGVRVWSVGRGV
jgi:hypothetical protein